MSDNRVTDLYKAAGTYLRVADDPFSSTDEKLKAHRELEAALSVPSVADGGGRLNEVETVCSGCGRTGKEIRAEGHGDPCVTLRPSAPAQAGASDTGKLVGLEEAAEAIWNAYLHSPICRDEYQGVTWDMIRRNETNSPRIQALYATGLAEASAAPDPTRRTE